MKKLIGCSILSVAACVASGGEWSFSGGAITDADGNWTLPAQFNSTAKTLTITGSPRSGSGLLDLDDPVVDGVEIQKVYFWNQLFEYGNAVITEFRCNRYWQPDEKNMTWALLRYNQSVTNISLGGPNAVYLWSDTARGCSNLVSLVLDFPNQTNISAAAIAETPKLASVTIRSSKRMTLPDGLFEKRTALTSVTLDLPQNTEIPDYLFSGCTALSDLNLTLGGGEGGGGGLTRIGSLAFNSCSKLVGDISTFCPPSVEVVATRAFEGCSGLTGSLVLTNLQHLGDAAFAWTKIQDVELRGPITQTEWKNSSYRDGVRFSGVMTLTNAVFDLPNVTSLYVNDFFNCWALKSVYFWRKPFSAESLRYLLNGKGLSPMTCTLYVSSQQWPWGDRAASGCRALTAEEKTDARRPERCLGMCDVGDPKVPEGDGKWTQQRLAWFARWPSPYDVPLGGIFVVR